MEVVWQKQKGKAKQLTNKSLIVRFQNKFFETLDGDGRNLFERKNSERELRNDRIMCKWRIVGCEFRCGPEN